MAPSDEGAVSEADWGRERLPRSQPVRLTAPLTRGAFQVRRRKGDRNMKATGIVRRVEECVIIEQTA